VADSEVVKDRGFRLSFIMIQQGEFSLAGRSWPGKSGKMTSIAFAPGGNTAFEAESRREREKAGKERGAVSNSGSEVYPIMRANEDVVSDRKCESVLEETPR
jgi:hypothetical protein